MTGTRKRLGLFSFVRRNVAGRRAVPLDGDFRCPGHTLAAIFPGVSGEQPSSTDRNLAEARFVDRARKRVRR